jgi:hypothetical protein
MAINATKISVEIPPNTGDGGEIHTPRLQRVPPPALLIPLRRPKLRHRIMDRCRARLLCAMRSSTSPPLPGVEKQEPGRQTNSRTLPGQAPAPH